MQITFSEDTHIIWLNNGTRWGQVNGNSMLHLRTKHSDGMSYCKSNIIESYENPAGNKLHLFGNYWFVWDHNFSLVSARSETSCGPHN